MGAPSAFALIARTQQTLSSTTLREFTYVQQTLSSSSLGEGLSSSSLREVAHAQQTLLSSPGESA
jgi:hypothetical protein